MRIQKLIIFLFLLLAASNLKADDKFTFEFAGGVNSSHATFSSKWWGDMSHYRLLFEEYAGRGSYSLNENLTISAMFGWIRQKGDRGDVIVFDQSMPPFGDIESEPFQQVVYFIPSAKISAAIFRIDLGAIIHDRLNDSEPGIFNYPFNGINKIRPSIGFEIGESNLYIVMKFLDSFPLYSGMGLSEVGLGGRVSGKYEQRAVVIGGPFGAVGLGYRGEFKLYRKSSAAFGFTAGGTDHDNIFTITLGVKTSFGK